MDPHAAISSNRPALNVNATAPPIPAPHSRTFRLALRTNHHVRAAWEPPRGLPARTSQMITMSDVPADRPTSAAGHRPRRAGPCGLRRSRSKSRGPPAPGTATAVDTCPRAARSACAHEPRRRLRSKVFVVNNFCARAPRAVRTDPRRSSAGAVATSPVGPPLTGRCGRGRPRAQS